MPASRRVIVLLRVTVSLLALQFLLGIWVNLFGSFPRTSDVATALSYSGDPVLTAHYALAVLLLLLAVLLAYVSFAPGEPRRLRGLTIAGLLSVLLALEAGVQFILSGFGNADWSFVMAFGFIASTAFYGVAQLIAVQPGNGFTPV